MLGILGTVVGAAIAGLIGWGTAWWALRRQWQHQEQTFATSLAVELRQVRRLLAFVQNNAQRPEPPQRRQAYEALRQSEEHARLLASFLVQFGALSGEVAGKVLEFSGRLNVLSWEVARRIPKRPEFGEAPENHEIGAFTTRAEQLGRQLGEIIKKLETETDPSSLKSD